jgi:hypothetical protein
MDGRENHKNDDQFRHGPNDIYIYIKFETDRTASSFFGAPRRQPLALLLRSLRHQEQSHNQSIKTDRLEED